MAIKKKTVEIETPTISKATPNLDVRSQVLDWAGDVEKEIKSQRTIRFVIPLERGERPGTKLPVTIGGYHMWFPKGKLIDVPESVANMLAEKYNMSGFDLKSRIDSDSKRRDTLS